jgi:cytochrome c peroxidase
MISRRLFLACSLAIVASACSDATTTVAPTAEELAISTALNLNPRALPNYANQPLPAYYAVAATRESVGLSANPITNAGATLGRVLFFDTQLSRTNNISCASCHAQSLAFGDSAQFSVGYEGGLTGAHSMRLTNARFNESGRFFWNKRALSLEAQTTEPVQDSIEMGFDAEHGGITVMLARLQGLPYYPPLFRLAFGTDVITEARVQRALAQYVRSILATNSKWDVGFTVVDAAPGLPNFATPLPNFTPQEQRGQAIYMAPPNAGGAGCQGCHVAPSFSLAANSLSNGLDAGNTVVFRAPSLKNVARSRRFMHDGRFTTLEQVVEFYDNGVQVSPTTDPRLLAPGGVPRRLNLSGADKEALVAFLRTLNEQSVDTDTRFSDPFRRP